MNGKNASVNLEVRNESEEDTGMKNLQRIAVLIDADNTRLSRLDTVIAELSAYGRIVVKKAYGNWKKSGLKNWENEVKHLAIKAVQQFDYVSGKNATDIVMTIDAMDLLHMNIYDAFALVSSDSDFTPLAIRLRESGAYVFGVGEKKTPEAFRNACDEFLLLEHVGSSDDAAVSPAQDDVSPEDEPVVGEELQKEDAAETSPPDIDRIHKLLKIAYDKYQNTEGFANIAAAGTYIKRVMPDFIPSMYGFQKLPKLVEAFPKKYEVKKYKGKGGGNIISYRCRDAKE